MESARDKARFHYTVGCHLEVAGTADKSFIVLRYHLASY